MTMDTGATSSTGGESSSSSSGAGASSAPATTSGGASSAPAIEGDAPVTPAAPAADGGQATVQTPPPFAPNFKFKVHDKELEFDPFLKDVIKDADTEKKVRELYEKAYGLDHVKTDRQQLRERLKGVETEFKKQGDGIQALSSMLQKKDYDSFFQATGVKEDDILRYALQVAQRRQNPELQARYQQEQAYKQQLSQAEATQAQLQEQYSQAATQAKSFELSQVLARPDVTQASQAFDARVGRPGAFQDEVIKRGQYHFFTSGQDISAEQAVNEVMALFVGQQQQQQQAPAQAPMVPQQTVSTSQAPEKKPVLPNIQGRGTSPVAKAPRSVADLRALARERGAV